MRVRVHAVVVRDGRLMVVRERHRDGERLVLPGARVNERESVTHALTRGVAHATLLEVEPIRLLHVLELRGRYGVRDLHMVWLAEPRDPAAVIPDTMLVDITEELPAPLTPPIVEQLRADLEEDWAHTPRWLGHVRRSVPELG